MAENLMEKLVLTGSAGGGDSDCDIKSGARPKSATPDVPGSEADMEGDAGGDDRYRQWRKAGADLRKAIASLSTDGSKVCHKKCTKAVAGSPECKKQSQGLNSPTSPGVSNQTKDTTKTESPQAKETENPVQNLKMLKTRVQEISAKYKLNLHNNEAPTGKSRRKLHTHAELTRNRLSVEIETSSESELDVDIHAARHSSPKLHKGKKPIQPWKNSSEDINCLKPDVSLSDSLPSSSKGNSTEPSPAKSSKSSSKTAADVKRKLFSGESPTSKPENPTLGEFIQKNKTMLHAPLLLTQTDSVLNLADISSTSENDEKHLSSPDESSTVTNTPLCTPAKDEEAAKDTQTDTHKQACNNEPAVSDSDLLAEELPDLVIENFAEDSGTEDNSKSITLSQEEISSLPDIESGHGSSSSGEEDADADDEFECDCSVCQQRNSDVQLARTDWLLDEEVFDVAESPSQGRVEYFAFSGHQGGLVAPYNLDMDSIMPLDVLISRNSSDVLELMFQNVIMQMLAVYPELLSDQAPPPATVLDIEKLDRVQITDEKIADDASCPICLCPFEKKDEALKMPCDHVFHGLCLRAWLNKSATCPVCRRMLSSTVTT